MLIIAGYLILAPSDRDLFIDGHLDLITQARQAPGCLDLSISPDPVDDTRVNNYELWENEESLAAWRKVANAAHTNFDFRGGHMAKYHVEKTGSVF